MPLANGDPIPVDLDARYDSNDVGLQYQVKQHRFAEIYGAFDPDNFSSERPPREVESAFREVFGEWAERGRVKIALHPYFKRWAMFERTFVPETGEPNAWACVSLFMEPAVAGLLPPDLDVPDHRFDNMRGRIGAFRMPTQRDFEIIAEYGDRHRLGVDGVVANSRREYAEQRKNAERTHEAFLHDFHSYHAWEITNWANRDAGSGWNLQSTPLVEHKSDPARWKREEVAQFDADGRKISSYTRITKTRGAEATDAPTSTESAAERQTRRQRQESAR